MSQLTVVPHHAPAPARTIDVAAWDPEPVERGAVSRYLVMLRRHRWKMLAAVAISGIATLIVSTRLTPLYESTATVDVDRHMPTAIVGQEATQGALTDTDQFLATQMKLIQSDAVLRPLPTNTNCGPTPAATRRRWWTRR